VPSADGSARDFDESVLFAVSPLTRFASARRSAASTLLTEKPTSSEQQPKAERKATNHWRFSHHPLRLRMVAPPVPLASPSLPPDGLRLLLHQASARFFAPTDPKAARPRLAKLLFRPWFFVDDWTVLARQTVELSDSLSHPDPPAKVQLKGSSLGRFRVFEALKGAFKLFTDTGAVDDDDLDEIKRSPALVARN
jgi:hypothetical protein